MSNYWEQHQIRQYFTNKKMNEKLEEWIFRNKNITFSKNYKILDIGCGYGRNIMNFAKKGCLIYGFDKCKESILFINNSDWKKENTHIWIDDMRDPNCLNNKYHLIIADGVLHQLEENYIRKIITQIKKMLFKNGLFFLSVFTSDVSPDNCQYMGNKMYMNESLLPMTLLSSAEWLELLNFNSFVANEISKENFNLDVGLRSNLTTSGVFK